MSKPKKKSDGRFDLADQIKKSKVELRKTDQLIPYARNARKHEDWQVAQIAASIKEFGFTNPVLIDETGEIVAGHCRVMSALKLGLEEVPCIVLGHLTPTQRKAYVLADNQLALNSSWDMGLLGVELEELKLDGFDLDVIGFGDDELKAILDGANQTQGTDGLTDPDEVPEVEKPIVTKGEVWVLGNHRLMCGDSTVVTDVEKLMGGEKADITFTSPPYNAAKNSYRNGLVRGFDNKYSDNQDAMDDVEYRSFLSDFTSIALTVSQFVFVNIQLLAHNRIPVIEYQNLFRENLKDILIWNKKQAPPNIVKGAFNTKFEFVFCFANDCKTRGFPASWQGKYPNVVETESNSGNEYADHHRAGFPVAFPLWFIERLDFTKSIYEPFCGTGTTIIACEKTGRRCFGMEIDPHYCTVILKRWGQFTGKEPARLEDDGSLTPMSRLAGSALP